MSPRLRVLARGLLLVTVLVSATAGGAVGSSASAAADEQCAQPSLPTTVAYDQRAGVRPDLTSLDVHTTSRTCDAPVVVWVHGGGYAVGDKARNMDAKVHLAREQGWVLVSVNYRLTRPRAAQPAQYPDHYEDVAAALAWVRDHIADYGGDRERIALLGHSAGADIVANLITEPKHLAFAGLEPSDLACAGPLDTEGFDKVAAGAAEQPQWQRALGNLPDYRTATSATHLARADAGIPPVIGVVRGNAERRAIETAFLARLDELGVPTTTVDARSLTHGQVSTRIGARGDMVMTPPLVTFLDDCFSR